MAGRRDVWQQSDPIISLINAHAIRRSQSNSMSRVCFALLGLLASQTSAFVIPTTHIIRAPKASTTQLAAVRTECPMPFRSRLDLRRADWRCRDINLFVDELIYLLWPQAMWWSGGGCVWTSSCATHCLQAGAAHFSIFSASRLDKTNHHKPRSSNPVRSGPLIHSHISGGPVHPFTPIQLSTRVSPIPPSYISSIPHIPRPPWPPMSNKSPMAESLWI